MANYHLTVNISNGVCDSMAYGLRSKIVDTSTGETHDRRGKGLKSWGIELCQNAPEEWHDPQKFCDAIVEVEKQKDAQQCRTFEGSLPADEGVTDEDRERIVRQFVSGLTKQGMCVAWAIHEPDEGNPNWHFHAYATLRNIDENGKFMAKCRKVYEMKQAQDEQGNPIFDAENKPVMEKIGIYDKKGNIKTDKAGRKQYKSKREDINDWNKTETLQAWRKDFEVIQNDLFKEKGIDAHVSCETLEKQGIDRIPQIHIPRKSWELMKQGKSDEWVERYKQIQEMNEAKAKEQAINAEIASLEEEIKEIDKEIAGNEQALIGENTPEKIPESTAPEKTAETAEIQPQTEKTTRENAPTSSNLPEVDTNIPLQKWHEVYWLIEKSTKKTVAVLDCRNEKQAAEKPANGKITENDETMYQKIWVDEKFFEQLQPAIKKSEENVARLQAKMAKEAQPEKPKETPAPVERKPVRHFPALELKPDKDIPGKYRSTELTYGASVKPDNYESNGRQYIIFENKEEREQYLLKRQDILPVSFEPENSFVIKLPPIAEIDPPYIKETNYSGWVGYMQRRAEQIANGRKITVEQGREKGKSEAEAWYDRNVEGENSLINKAKDYMQTAVEALEKYFKKNNKPKYTREEIATMDMNTSKVRGAESSFILNLKTKFESMAKTATDHILKNITAAFEKAKQIQRTVGLERVEPKGTFEFESTAEHRRAVKAYKEEFAGTMREKFAKTLRNVRYNYLDNTTEKNERHGFAIDVYKAVKPEHFYAAREAVKRDNKAAEIAAEKKKQIEAERRAEYAAERAKNRGHGMSR